ncbi:MAG TPA: GntP family permease [Melioribacteraceae bacterium]|nr:GntP family permease [Melioribacteraceae bacterium]
MTNEFIIIASFVISIALIILLTARFKVNAFYVLILIGIGMGLVSGLSPEKVIQVLKEGFGNTLASIGLIIVFGTTLGLVLEKTGAAYTMAEYILKKVGTKNAPLAMTITGFIFGIPIFCDSGYVVLSSLNKSVAARTRKSMTIMGSLLGISLYSVHCLIPPHPGATAAAGIIGASIGKLMLIGLGIAMIALAAGFLWIRFLEKRNDQPDFEIKSDMNQPESALLRYPLLSFLPVFLPIVLIAIKSVLLMYSISTGGLLVTIIYFIGDPAIALLIGIVISLFVNTDFKFNLIHSVLEDSIKNAGIILLITAAGGAFGAILKASGVGTIIGEQLSQSGLGIFIPFLIAAGLKTAQGSSTVSIITTSSIILPMLSELQLATEMGLILAVLSMGAGSMVFSHTNDSYFWVVTKFSSIELNKSLKVFSSSTIVLGLSAQIIIFLLAQFLI